MSDIDDANKLLRRLYLRIEGLKDGQQKFAEDMVALARTDPDAAIGRIISELAWKTAWGYRLGEMKILDDEHQKKLESKASVDP